jgi:hypothetical protein
VHHVLWQLTTHGSDLRQPTSDTDAAEAASRQARETVSAMAAPTTPGGQK